MKSLRTRLTRDLLIVTLSLVALSCTCLFLVARAMLIEQFDHALKAQAYAVGALLENEKGTLILEAPEKLPAQFREPKLHAYFEVIAKDGTTILRSATQGDASLLPVGTPNDDKNHYWDLSLPNGRDGRAVVLRFSPRQASPSDQEEPEIQVRILVAEDRRDLDEMLESFVLVATLSGLALVLGTLLLVPRVLRKGLHPLAELAEQSTSIKADCLSLRFSSDNMPSELEAVTKQLNELLARLEQSFERERRVNADLAHELRTPVAELRMLAESAIKWPSKRDVATDKDALEIALHLEGLITQMLALARSEHAPLLLAPVELNLAEILGKAMNTFRSKARERNLELQEQLEAVIVTSDAVLLRSILNNLVDNAVDYASPGGRLVIACARNERGEACINISNTCVGLTREDLGRLFERFWRKDEARSREGHLGLGLSLVKAYAQALGWEVEASLEEGTMFRVSLVEKLGK